MVITVKIYSCFRKYVNDGIPDKQGFKLDFKDAGVPCPTLAHVLAFLDIPHSKIGFFIHNGVIVRDPTILLADEDVVVISPSIGGG